MASAGYLHHAYQIICSLPAFPFFFRAEDGIRYYKVTGVQTCALPISDMADSSFFCDIHEFELSGLAKQILEQAVARPPSRRRGKLRAPRVLSRIERRALNHIHIQVVVVVVIEEGYTGAHDFRHVVFAVSARKMVELQPDFLGDFAEEWNLRRKAENGTGKLVCCTR